MKICQKNTLKTYTKKGDKGFTQTIIGQKIEKHNLLINTQGLIDELNAWVGLLRHETLSETLKTDLKYIQNILFEAGTFPMKIKKNSHTSTNQIHTDFLEKKIDTMEAELPKLTNFLIPYGNRTSSYGHLTRTICRKCERQFSELNSIHNVFENELRFFNRLSDYFFIFIRFVDKYNGITVEKWNSTS